MVRELGLLNKTRTLSVAENLSAMGPVYRASLFKCARLMCSFDFDYVTEGLQHELALRSKVSHLQDYRTNGLKRKVRFNFNVILYLINCVRWTVCVYY